MKNILTLITASVFTVCTTAQNQIARNINYNNPVVQQVSLDNVGVFNNWNSFTNRNSISQISRNGNRRSNPQQLQQTIRTQSIGNEVATTKTTSNQSITQSINIYKGGGPNTRMGVDILDNEIPVLKANPVPRNISTQMTINVPDINVNIAQGNLFEVAIPTIDAPEISQNVNLNLPKITLPKMELPNLLTLNNEAKETKVASSNKGNANATASKNHNFFSFDNIVLKHHHKSNTKNFYRQSFKKQRLTKTSVYNWLKRCLRKKSKKRLCSVVCYTF